MLPLASFFILNYLNVLYVFSDLCTVRVCVFFLSPWFSFSLTVALSSTYPPIPVLRVVVKYLWPPNLLILLFLHIWGGKSIFPISKKNKNKKNEQDIKKIEQNIETYQILLFNSGVLSL